MLVNRKERNIIKVKPVGAGVVGARYKWCYRSKEQLVLVYCHPGPYALCNPLRIENSRVAEACV